MKSLRTEWSAGTAAKSIKSYITANMQNLGAQHSKLDVHKCKSATCEVCRPNLGKVDMVPVNQSEASTARAMAMRHTQSSHKHRTEGKHWGEEPRCIPSSYIPQQNVGYDNVYGDSHGDNSREERNVML